MANRTRLLALAVVAGLVLSGASLVATGRVVVASSVVTDTGTSLYETATNGFAFANRSYNDLPLDTKINVSFFDSSDTPHTFTLINESDFWLANYSTYPVGALDTLLKSEGTLVNLTAGGGNHSDGSFTSPSAASYYLFVCAVAGHFQLGMWGIVAFGEVVPANIGFGSGTPGPGLAVFIIIGTIVALTVLAIVLGFVVGQRRGSEHEMPPERLGYPEPSSPAPLPASSPRPPGPR